MLRRVGLGCTVLSILILTSTSCSRSTGVVRLDDNLYLTNRQDEGETSGSRVKIVIYQEAVEFCRSQGKKMEVVSTQQSDKQLGKMWAGAEIQFRCI